MTAGRPEACVILPGFDQRRMAVDGIEINLRVGGDGPPLLLRGYLQTRLTWHRIAPVLAERWRAVAQDVRGKALPAGHFLPEDAPQATVDALLELP